MQISKLGSQSYLVHCSFIELFPCPATRQQKQIICWHFRGLSYLEPVDYWMTHIFAFCRSVQLFVCYWVSSNSKDWVHALVVCFPVGMAKPGQDQPHPCSLPSACQFSTVRRHGVTSHKGTKLNSPMEELEPRSLALQWHIAAQGV